MFFSFPSWLRRSSRVLIPIALISLNSCHNASGGPVPETFYGPESRGYLGGVASEAVECSTIGRDLLARGGNAADALVGTVFCVGVVGMYDSGIGGGGFALIRDADGEYEAVDFRETAPAAAHKDMYRGNVNGSVIGGLAVAVPGELRGIEYIHFKYGRLPWKLVMQGAIHVARNGFRDFSYNLSYELLSEDMIRKFRIVNAIDDENSFLVKDPNFAIDFAPNGTLVGLGDFMTRKRYADTLEKIAEEGSDALYSGRFSRAIIQTIQQDNGTMTMTDLANYRVAIRPVEKMRYRGLDLHTIGAPASGSVCIGILKTMEQYDVADRADANLTLHRFVEALRFSYASRAQLGDPDFIPDMADFERHLLDARHARHIRNRISDDHTQPLDAYDPSQLYTSDGQGTSHVVTADRSGMALSLTTTINLPFGARLVVPESGIILNNEMNDFSIPHVSNEFGFKPHWANFIRPGKRPLSSIAPVIADRLDGSLFLTIGAAGGSRIISAVAQTLWHIVEHAMTVTEALREPRLHDQLMPNVLVLERGFQNGTEAAFTAKGHNVNWLDGWQSAVQAVVELHDGSLEAASDPRQKNSAGLSA